VIGGDAGLVPVLWSRPSMWCVCVCVCVRVSLSMVLNIIVSLAQAYLWTEGSTWPALPQTFVCMCVF